MSLKSNYLSALLISFVFIISANAQHTDLVDSSQTQVLADTSKSGRYIMPELSHKQMRWSRGGNGFMSIHLGFAPIVDYDLFFQDNASISQVGKQNNQADLRSGRMMFSGQLKFKHPWRYLFSIEYKGLDRSPEQDPIGITDLAFTIPVGKTLGNMIIGKTKETFVYEMVGDAANLPYTERILSPFFASRNTGIKFSNAVLKDRMTWAAGWFNDFLIKNSTVDASVNTVTARITGLPVWENNGRHYLHLALSARYLESNNGKMRLKGRPESNVTSNYLDTKDFEADHGWYLGSELLWNRDNHSVLMEYVKSFISSPINNNPEFTGFTVTGSWVLSPGDFRPYDRKAGFARRIKPGSKHGAFELVGRFSYVTLDDQKIKGGTLNKAYMGLNWWASQYWRVSAGWGPSDLLLNGYHGTTNHLLFRLQWIY
ncbi:MAG: hypothetical protein RLZZ28_1410 [Bacteroidota bacterium]